MILKRILAYLLDYIIIIAYAGILFLLTLVIHHISDKPIITQDPITGNVISFFTLTLPVFLYFYFYESSSKNGTLGKQKLKIRVINNTKRNVFIRVLLKILPWEIAHFAVHWSVYYSNKNIDTPLWVWVLLILPQIIVLIYFMSVLLSRGTSSIYDRIANTGIQESSL
ncbi:RDD family protein [uncultured Psychroserpens sp.]|uniref:RDD family protein n=1 Tax=uncultured Psychroserpens sp. TaxID=255436 RepID=UPI0026355A7A|nr:RDD family protein [uncultured Psychroserpens sp.]